MKGQVKEMNEELFQAIKKDLDEVIQEIDANDQVNPATVSKDLKAIAYDLNTLAIQAQNNKLK
jgi:hypothetical protein